MMITVSCKSFNVICLCAGGMAHCTLERLGNHYSAGSTSISTTSCTGRLMNLLWWHTLIAIHTCRRTWQWRWLTNYTAMILACEICENQWIRTLGTSSPSGMNLRVDSLRCWSDCLWTYVHFLGIMDDIVVRYNWYIICTRGKNFL